MNSQLRALREATISVMEVSPRLTRWVNTQFPKGSSDQVLEALRELPNAVIGGQDPERIQASLVFRAGGDWYAFQQRLDLARSDWRDSLVGAGLGNEDWRGRLDEVLGEEQ